VATQCKLYRNTPQVIQPKTWTVLEFDKALRNDHNMSPDLTLITPPKNGDFIWARNVRWNGYVIPEGDDRPRQFMEQFCRDPYGAPDDTGADDSLATPGKSWNTTMWPFLGRAGQPVGVRVWHDHHEPVEVGHCQFVGMTWDY
jgi:hypothetical protein